MRNEKIMLMISLVLALTACNDHDRRAAVNGSENQTQASPPAAPAGYLAYVRKMIATTNDAEEPWNLEGITVERSDDKEAVEIN